MNAAAMIDLAERHAPQAAMASSAQLNAVEARQRMVIGDEAGARVLALRSLRYSLGLLSPLYAAAAADVDLDAGAGKPVQKSLFSGLGLPAGQLDLFAVDGE